jgi:hypothetical protein
LWDSAAGVWFQSACWQSVPMQYRSSMHSEQFRSGAEFEPQNVHVLWA